MITDLQPQVEVTDLLKLTTLTFHNWVQSDSKEFVGSDAATGIVATLSKPNASDANKKPWEIQLFYGSKRLAVLREKLLDDKQVYAPKPSVLGSNVVGIARAVEDAKQLDVPGLLVSGTTYRYTTNGNLYRLFTGTTDRDTNLLPQLNYYIIYARLHKNPTATLVVNLELKSRKGGDQDFNPGHIPSMEEIDKLIAQGHQ